MFKQQRCNRADEIGLRLIVHMCAFEFFAVVLFAELFADWTIIITITDQVRA